MDIYDPGFAPQFSGHETFPLRYSWLKKVHDAFSESATDPNNRSVFVSDQAISRFGVGKNMVGSMHHWSLATRMLEDTSGCNKGPYKTTALSRSLFDSENGWDPFIESPATLWLIHWELASNPLPATTTYYAFNYFRATVFYRQQLAEEIQRYCDGRGAGFKIAAATIKRDVDCFLRTYAERGSSREDSLDSLLAELSLIKAFGKNDGFALTRGAKPSLDEGIFLYALISYTQRRSTTRTFSTESLLHEPGSPGRIFLLDEESMLERLSQLDHATRGRIAWSETAGLRQIVFNTDPRFLNPLTFAARSYNSKLGAEQGT